MQYTTGNRIFVVILFFFCFFFFFSSFRIFNQWKKREDRVGGTRENKRVKKEIKISQSLNHICDFFLKVISIMCVFTSLSFSLCRFLARVYCFLFYFSSSTSSSNGHQQANHMKSKIKILRIRVNKQITRSFRFIFYEALNKKMRKKRKTIYLCSFFSLLLHWARHKDVPFHGEPFL